MPVKSLRWITVWISDILSIVYSYCVSLNAWFKQSWNVVHWNMYICYICRFKTYTYIRRASTCINFPLKVVVAVPPPLPPTPPPHHPRPRVTYGLFSPTKQSLIPIYSKTIRETIHVHPPISGWLCSIFLHTFISTLTYSFVFSLGI